MAEARVNRMRDDPLHAAVGRYVPALFAFVAVTMILAQLPVLLQVAGTPNYNGYGGIDFDLYRNVTQRWLAGGHFYEPYQLSGPYQIGYGDILYPPVALWLFVPFTFLPSFLWWALPIGVTALVMLRHRPRFVVWPLLAACISWQPVQIHIISGNPVIWSMAAVALGTVYTWPAPFALIKPSLGPFALIGIWRKAWWVGLLVLTAMSLPLLPMWFDWLTAVLNSRGGGLFYSWQEAPLLAMPIIAWVARPGGRYGRPIAA